MARLAPMIARFTQSPSADVVANRVRILPDDVGFSYGAAYAQVDAPIPSGDGFSRIDLAQLEGVDQLEGEFDVWITAVDARGNESTPLEIDKASFDFSAPEAPTDGAIENA